MRYKFDQVFRKNSNGSLTPIRKLHVRGVTFGYGVSFNQGVSFGGIDFFQFEGKDIEADEENGILNIKGFYN